MARLTEPERKRLAEKYVGLECTLNGKPAQIVGRELKFARVRQLEQPFFSIEYAWETVAAVMTYTGGQFRA